VNDDDCVPFPDDIDAEHVCWDVQQWIFKNSDFMFRSEVGCNAKDLKALSVAKSIMRPEDACYLDWPSPHHLEDKALLELEESRIEKRLHKKVNNKVSAIKMGRDTFITRIEAALRCAVPYIPYCAPTKFRLPDCDFTADWKECNKEKGCRWHEEKTKCVAVLGWGPFGDETVRDHPKQYLEESVAPEIVNVFRPEDCFKVKRHHQCNSHRVCRWVIDEYRNHEEYHHCIALPEGPDVIPIERDCSMIFDITSCSDNTLCEWDEIEMFCVVREVPIRTVPRKGKGEKTVSKL